MQPKSTQSNPPNRKTYPLKWVVVLCLLSCMPIGGGLLAIAVFRILPNLPSTEALANYRPKQPIRIVTADGKLLQEFGDERRVVISFQDFPDVLKLAILAAEDQRFYQHQGVDYIGLVRAFAANLVSIGYRQGASTITMQLARSYFLSSERKLMRKIYEILLAVKLEHELNKNQIFEIYMNQIYLGQRSYGFGAASEVYYGKAPKNLTLAEAAMLGGLPQSPSRANPIHNLKLAQQRQAHVLRRMKEAGYISVEQEERAKKEELHVRSAYETQPIQSGSYAAEMARIIAINALPPKVIERGITIVTTIREKDQQAAHQALHLGLAAYDQRHGYRGIEDFVELPPNAEQDETLLAAALENTTDYDGYSAALVLSADKDKAHLYKGGGEFVSVKMDKSSLLAESIQKKLPANKRIRRGAIVRISPAKNDSWLITQLPEVEGAFISCDPKTGRIYSVVGGSDFQRTKYNRATQAYRQPGSSFKPFIYSAALEKGYMPGTLVPDEPVLLSPEETGGEIWEPKNYDDTQDGPITIRTALKRSRNLATIQLLQRIGIDYARDFSQRFGFENSRLPRYLALALGAGSAAPWDMLTAYATFANGGYHVEPYLVSAIYDAKGQQIAHVNPLTAGDDANRVLDPRNAYLMTSLMQDVVRSGTGARAAQLGRNDIAGKTGTTNDYVDAWFAGYQAGVVAVSWVGFDQPRSLGRAETGGAVALPIWMYYMRSVLDQAPQEPMKEPPGITKKEYPMPGGGEADDIVYEEYSTGGSFFYTNEEISAMTVKNENQAVTDTEAESDTTPAAARPTPPKGGADPQPPPISPSAQPATPQQ